MKSRLIFLFTFFLSVFSLNIVKADIIYLKSGGKLEGKITSQTREGYEIKVKAGKLFIKIEDVEKVEEKEIDVSKIYSPLEEYSLRFSKIDPANAEAHFQLGMFCFENKLYEEAGNELRLVKKLNSSYAEKVDRLLKQIEESKPKADMLRKQEPVKIDAPLETEVFNSSTAGFNKEGFAMFLNTFKDKDKRTEFLRECLSKAQEYERQGYAEAKTDERQKKLLSALEFYRQAAFSEELQIASTASESIKKLTRKLVEPQEGKLSMPIGRLYNEINEMMANISGEEAQRYCDGYLKMGKNLEAEADNLGINSSDFKSKLRSALNCYLIVYNFTNEEAIRKEVLTSIKRCNKRL